MYDKTGKSSSVHNICKFMSLKNNRAVRTLSILEFDFCYHLEYNPDITSYRSQPYGFHYQFNGRQCRYTPDFSAKGANNESVFFEVKPSSKIWEPDFRARFAVKQKVAQESLGKKLILITEKTIRLNPILNNLKLLHRYAGLHTTTQAELLVLKFIQKYKLVQLKDVSQLLQIPEHETLISALCWLSAGKLKTDLKSDFCLDSFVWT